MKENINNSLIWNEASKGGLFLGILCCIYSLAVTFLDKSGNGQPLITMLISLAEIILWLAKLVGCVVLLRLFMKQFASRFSGVDNLCCAKFGRRVALLSALIVGAYTLAQHSILFPEDFNSQIDTILQAYSSMMDSNTLSAMEGMRDKLPALVAGWTFVYCYVYGAIVSVILARNIPPRDPFSTYRSTDRDSRQAEEQ